MRTIAILLAGLVAAAAADLPPPHEIGITPMSELQTQSTRPVCPPDRPIAREIVTHDLCTLVACLGALRCPKEGPCYRLPAGACNTCAAQTMTLCLSPDELDTATEQGR